MFSGALRPNALRSECIRQPVERMGNQMEKIRLKVISVRLDTRET